MQYLKQMRGAFKKRYELAELNIDYYISLLENASLWKGEGTRTKEFFLDKWHQLLTRKEYDYQYMHINSLCEGFDLLIRNIKRLVLNVVNLIISIIVYKTIYAIFGYSLMTAY